MYLKNRIKYKSVEFLENPENKPILLWPIDFWQGSKKKSIYPYDGKRIIISINAEGTVNIHMQKNEMDLYFTSYIKS